MIYFQDFKNNALVYFSLFLLFSNYMLFTAFNWAVDFDFDSIKLFIRIFVFFLLLISILSNGFIKKNIFFMLLYCLFLFALNFNEVLLNFIYLFMIIGSMKNIFIDNVFLSVLYLYLIFSIIHVSLFLLGAIVDVDSVYGDRLRHSFGFTNVNRLGIFYFYFLVLCTYFLLNSKCLLKFVSLFGLIASIFYIILSDSRTALYCSLLLFALIALGKFHGIYKLERFFLNFCIIFCSVISFYLSTSIGQVWNDVLSFRPAYFEQYTNFLYSSSGFFFGLPLIDEITVDNSYILFSGAFGLLSSILFYFVSPFLIFNVKVDRILCASIIVILFYGVFESNLLRVEMLLPIIVFYYLFFQEKSIKQELNRDTN